MWVRRTRVTPGATLGLLVPDFAIYCLHDAWLHLNYDIYLYFVCRQLCSAKKSKRSKRKKTKAIIVD